MTTISLVSREMLGDQVACSDKRAKDWGRTGAPADLQSKAVPFRLGSEMLVSTCDKLVGALCFGCPVTICAKKRLTLHPDEDGFSQSRGETWGVLSAHLGVAGPTVPAPASFRTGSPTWPTLPGYLTS